MPKIWAFYGDINTHRFSGRHFNFSEKVQQSFEGGREVASKDLEFFRLLAGAWENTQIFRTPFRKKVEQSIRCGQGKTNKMPDFLLGSLPELGISKCGLRVSEPIFSETASVWNVSDPHLAPTSLFWWNAKISKKKRTLSWKTVGGIRKERKRAKVASMPDSGVKVEREKTWPRFPASRPAGKNTEWKYRFGPWLWARQLDVTVKHMHKPIDSGPEFWSKKVGKRCQFSLKFWQLDSCASHWQRPYPLEAAVGSPMRAVARSDSVIFWEWGFKWHIESRCANDRRPKDLVVLLHPSPDSRNMGIFKTIFCVFAFAFVFHTGIDST